MKRTICLILTLLLTTVCFASCGEKDEGQVTRTTASAGKNQDVHSDETNDMIASTKLLTGTHHAQIVVKDYGTMELELDADTAPISVTHFVKLAKNGFYDGLTFHRIISGFMIQGGDEGGDGISSPEEETIKGEFNLNGVENNIKHERGVISMARTPAYDSASSQFFIMHQTNPSLDGQYAAFGHVTSGIEIVDQICADTPVTDDNGTVLAKDQPVITTIKIID